MSLFGGGGFCLSGDAVDWSLYFWLILGWDGYHFASSENRRFCCCCCYPSSFVSECDSVSDREMKPISPYLTCIPVFLVERHGLCFLVERHGLFRRGDLRIAGSSLSPRYKLFYHHHSLVTAWTGRDRWPRRVGAEADKPICPDYCS